MKCKGKAFWSYLNVLDTKYKPCWWTTLVISREEAAKLIELGLKKQVRKIDSLKDPEKAEYGEYEIKFVQYEEKRGKIKGNNQKPDVVDADNEPFEDILGNGSTVIVKFDVFKWNNNFGSGVGANLLGVKVIELVPYEPISPSADSTEEEITIVPTKDDSDDDDKW